jgi:uncharacterized cupredoxin-like copper-binding protein
MTAFGKFRPRRALLVAGIAGGLVGAGAAWSAGDLSRQTPIEVTVDLGKPGQHAFVPSQLKFETGKLYKLILRNPSEEAHYFTSDAFTPLIYTRKVQVTQQRDGKTVTLAEFKGAIREIEVYPGHAAEWWCSCRSRRDARAICVAALSARTARATPITAWSARS